MFLLKLFLIFSSKIDSITLDPDPNWAKILDPDPNSMYLDPQVHNTCLSPNIFLQTNLSWPMIDMQRFSSVWL